MGRGATAKFAKASVIGVFYYLRVVKLMYFDEPVERAAIQGSGAMRFVLTA